MAIIAAVDLILLVLALFFLLKSFHCRIEYFCGTVRRVLYPLLGISFLFTLAGFNYWYFSKPTLEDVKDIFSPTGGTVNLSSLEREGISVNINLLEGKLENNPILKEEIKNALCASIGEKLSLKNFSCKFYTEALDDTFLVVNLKCNILGVCGGFVNLVNYKSEQENKETRLGKVEFRL